MVSRIDPARLKADWGKYQRRPTWSVISSRELAEVLGVHLQTISNWSLREVLPAPVRHKRLWANKNYYRISQIRAWLEGRPEIDIHREWAARSIAPSAADMPLDQLETLIIRSYKAFNVEQPTIPLDLSMTVS